MRIGRIFDIDIYVSNYLLLLVVVLLITGHGGNFTAVFFVFFIHEMSHILTARMLKMKVDEIELLPFGGAIKIQSMFEFHAGFELHFLLLLFYL